MDTIQTRYNLLLDDLRDAEEVERTCPIYDRFGPARLPQAHWLIALNYVEFCRIIRQRGIPTLVTFDHDLCSEHYRGIPTAEKTGLDCVQWLYRYCLEHNLRLPRWCVHTMNPEGSLQMRTFLRRAEAVLLSR